MKEKAVCRACSCHQCMHGEQRNLAFHQPRAGMWQWEKEWNVEKEKYNKMEGTISQKNRTGYTSTPAIIGGHYDAVHQRKSYTNHRGKKKALKKISPKRRNHETLHNFITVFLFIPSNSKLSSLPFSGCRPVPNTVRRLTAVGQALYLYRPSL